MLNSVGRIDVKSFFLNCLIQGYFSQLTAVTFHTMYTTIAPLPSLRSNQQQPHEFWFVKCLIHHLRIFKFILYQLP